MFWDAGQQNVRRDHVIMDDTFLGVVTSHSRFGARTVAIVTSAISRCAPPRTRPTDVLDMLLACSAKIADANRDPSDDHGTASVVLAWEKFERRVEFAHCGGGHAFHLRGDALTPIVEASSLARLAREQGHPPNALHATALVSMLGVPNPQVTLGSIEWEPDDLIVIISASADAPTNELMDIVRAAGRDVPTMAGRIGQDILDRARTLGVTVIAQRMRPTASR